MFTKLNITTRFNEDCICGKGGISTLYIDNITKTRTLLRCYRCKGIVAWQDHETEAEQEERIRKYKSDNPTPKKWSTAELAALHKPPKPKENPLKRKWTDKELEELV